MSSPRCEPALAGFLAAIMANPDGPERLIMADFLEERGDPRAAALRQDGRWWRRPKGFNKHQQALLWHPGPVEFRTRFVAFAYGFPFPRCCGGNCIAARKWGRNRAADVFHNREGVWLCRPCFRGTSFAMTPYVRQVFRMEDV